MLRAVAEACSHIVTMLPSSDVVASVAEEPDGLLAGSGTQALLIEMTSASPGRTRALVGAIGPHCVKRGLKDFRASRLPVRQKCLIKRRRR